MNQYPNKTEAKTSDHQNIESTREGGHSEDNKHYNSNIK